KEASECKQRRPERHETKVVRCEEACGYGRAEEANDANAYASQGIDDRADDGSTPNVECGQVVVGGQLGWLVAPWRGTVAGVTVPGERITTVEKCRAIGAEWAGGNLLRGVHPSSSRRAPRRSLPIGVFGFLARSLE